MAARELQLYQVADDEQYIKVLLGPKVLSALEPAGESAHPSVDLDGVGTPKTPSSGSWGTGPRCQVECISVSVPSSPRSESSDTDEQPVSDSCAACAETGGAAAEAGDDAIAASRGEVPGVLSVLCSCFYRI